MFGKVNVLLLVVFSAILGVQLFGSWNADAERASEQHTAATAVDFAATSRAATPSALTAERLANGQAAAAELAAADVVVQRRPVAQPIVETTPLAAQANSVLEPTEPVVNANFRSEQLDTQTTPAPAPASNGGLPITYAEALNIRFHGYSQISGVYSINDDETVSIPVIDRVSVTGLDGAQLEAVLAQRVFEINGRHSDVTVEVERYQPIFVSGGVQLSGSFEWRRNMTVMHAVALSGGLYRSPERQNAGVSLIDARLSVERSLSELRRALVRSARLQAERDGVDRMRAPERLIALVGEGEAERLIEGEQALLIAARSAAALEIEAVEASLRAARDEILRLEDFETSVRAKLDERREFVDRMVSLEERGYVSEERMTDLRTSIIDLETRLAQVRVSMSQADAGRLALERQRIALVQSRAAEVSEELVVLEADIHEKTLAYEAAIARRAEIAGSRDAAAIAAENRAAPITYTIVRRTQNGMETMTVDEFEAILPGDIVRVEVPRVELGGAMTSRFSTGVN